MGEATVSFKRKVIQYALLSFVCGVCFDHFLIPRQIKQHGSTPSAMERKDEEKHDSSSTTDEDDFALASNDSFGFFDDIPSKDWEWKRDLARNTKHQLIPSKEAKAIENLDEVGRWYTNNWHPYFTCPQEQLIGTVGDGHKYVCDPHRLKKLDDCLVYSVGSDGEFSFEDALYALAPNCEIHIFDFGDYAEIMKKDFPNLKATLHPFGMAGSGKHPSNVKSMQEILARLGHEGRRIDILKVDCEGCEWDSYTDWLEVPNQISQVFVESHRVRTKFFQDMYDAGYVLFHKEPNTQWKGGCEWAYLKLARSFLQ